MPMTARAYRNGFTLLEVNLAVFIMATGILSVCALYSLGFRENRQSVEDVAGAAYAEAYLSPLIQGLSATNMPWSAWVEIGEEPSTGATRSQNVADAVWPRAGWSEYIDGKPRVMGNPRAEKEEDRDLEIRYRVAGSPRSTADTYWSKVNGQIPSPYNGTMPSIPSGFEYALVITRRGPVIQLAFRCARRRETLLTMPAFVTEVRFNGDPEK